MRIRSVRKDHGTKEKLAARFRQAPIFIFSFLIVSFTFPQSARSAEENLQKENSSGKEIELRLSKPLVPTPSDYLVPQETSDGVPIGLCGNGIVETDEECDDGNAQDGDGCSAGCKKEDPAKCGNGVLDEGEACDGESGCPEGKMCDQCQCVVPEALCGNLKLEEGEECDGPEFSCPEGERCEFCACRLIEEGTCGNGVAEEGETCGEPSLPPCEPGEQCINCRCGSEECGYMDCPGSSECQVHYCRDTDGTCSWDAPEPKNPSALHVVNYASGSLQVTECCADVSYQLFAGFNPCTGVPDPSSYEVRVMGTMPMSGEQCRCPVFEESNPGAPIPPGGEIEGCEEAIDPAAGVQVAPVGGGELAIRVSCSNCCGDAVETERTLPPPSPQSPASCSGLECPSSKNRF